MARAQKNESSGSSYKWFFIAIAVMIGAFYMRSDVGQQWGEEAKNTITSIGLILGALIVLVGFLYWNWFRTGAKSKEGMSSKTAAKLSTKDKHTQHASAAWSDRSILQKGKVVISFRKWREPRVYCGEYSGASVSVDREQKVLVQGMSGTGKTVLLVQSIYHWLKSGGDAIIGDVKPELYAMLKPALEEMDIKVICLAPFRNVGDSYDLFNDISQEEGERENALEIIAGGMVPPAEGDGAFFVEIARTFIYILLSYIRHIKAPLGDILNVYEQLEKAYDEAFEAEKIRCADNDEKFIFPNFIEWFGTIIESTGDVSATQKLRLLAKVRHSGNTWAGIQGEVLRSLEWATNPTCQRFVRGNLSLSDYFSGNRQVVVFIMHPDDDWDSAEKVYGVKDKFFSMLTGYVFNVLKKSKGRKRPCLVALDELGNFPPVPNLSGFLKVCRDRHISAVLATQFIRQLDDKYGDMLRESASVLLSYAVGDHESAEIISEKLGDVALATRETHTSGALDRSRSEVERITTRRLLAAHEIEDLPPGELVFYHRGLRAVGRAKEYWKDRELRKWIQKADDYNRLPNYINEYK